MATLSEMKKEYQDDLCTKMSTLHPLTEVILTILRDEFPTGFGFTNFRRKSIERILEKDIKEYKGLSGKETQVKDLFAGRLFSIPDNHDEAEAMKRKVLDRLNDLFPDELKGITFKSEFKPKMIDVFGDMKLINPMYVTFNGHIELQVVTFDEHNILTITHNKYVKDRMNPDKVIAIMLVN